MIKFNNFPPARAGDVELTQDAKRIMAVRGDLPWTIENGQRDATFEAYGESAGRTVISNMDASYKDEDNAFHNAFKIIAPLIDTVNDIAGGDAGRAFISGFDTARWGELSKTSSEVKA